MCGVSKTLLHLRSHAVFMPFSIDSGGLCCSGVTCFLRQSPPNVHLFLLFRVFRVGGFRCRLLVVPLRHKEDTKVWRVVFRERQAVNVDFKFPFVGTFQMSRTEVFVFFLPSFVARWWWWWLCRGVGVGCVVVVVVVVVSWWWWCGVVWWWWWCGGGGGGDVVVVVVVVSWWWWCVLLCFCCVSVVFLLCFCCVVLCCVVCVVLCGCDFVCGVCVCAKAQLLVPHRLFRVFAKSGSNLHRSFSLVIVWVCCRPSFFSSKGMHATSSNVYFKQL